MISSCEKVALVALFPTKLVSLHSEFPSPSYRIFRFAEKEKEKLHIGPGGTTASGTGLSTARAVFPYWIQSGTEPVLGR
jgi:hypothetical protein